MAPAPPADHPNDSNGWEVDVRHLRHHAEALVRLLDATESANGFANRFLWVCVRRSKCLPEGGNIHTVDFAEMVRKLTEADRLLAEGKDVADVCRVLQVSEATYHRWRNQFGGLKADDAKRLKELERENATLKRLLADAELEKAALKEIAKGEF